ncbi:MAG: sulfotransferase [Planctomycetota bacterium]
MFESVLWLTGMPRSGTNWVSQILASSPAVRMKFCPLFSYEFKNRLDARSSAAEWAQLLAEVYETRSDYLDQEYLRKDGLVPSFVERLAAPPVLGIKSTRFHDLAEGLLEKVPKLRFIALVRNPAAVVHSWLTNPHEFPRDADPRAEWRSGACRNRGADGRRAVGEFWGFEDWKETTRRYLRLEREAPMRVRVLHYEALVDQPEPVTRDLFAWAGLPFTGQTAAFLAASTKGSDSHKRSVFKSSDVADRWVHEIDPFILRAIEEDLDGDPLCRFLSTRV